MGVPPGVAPKVGVPPGVAPKVGYSLLCIMVGYSRGASWVIPVVHHGGLFLLPSVVIPPPAQCGLFFSPAQCGLFFSPAQGGLFRPAHC